MNAFWRALLVPVSLGSHPGFVISERFKSGFRAALIQPLPILNRAGPEFSVGDGELSAVQLRLASIDPHPVLQVGQVRWRRLPLIDCAAQGMQERSLPDGVTVSVLGQQPRRSGALLTGQRPSWPAPGVEKFAKPPGVFLIDALPLRRHLVREPGHVLPLRRGCQVADPLILITPGQQLAPQFFIHAAIPSLPCPLRKTREADHPVTPDAAGADASPGMTMLRLWR